MKFKYYKLMYLLDNNYYILYVHAEYKAYIFHLKLEN